MVPARFKSLPAGDGEADLFLPLAAFFAAGFLAFFGEALFLAVFLGEALLFGEALFFGEAAAFLVGEEAGDGAGDAFGLAFGLGDALGEADLSSFAAGLRPRLGLALAFFPPVF